MPRYDELKTVRKLSDRGDTNSVVHLVKEANADNLYVRKVIFGIEQPLYQGIFLREVQALYKLNNCDNIVKIISHRNMVYTDAATKVKERVGCIFLEYISGETLAKTIALSQVNFIKSSAFHIRNCIMLKTEYICIRANLLMN